jgi:MSHA biogenesis protein MshQ
VLTGSLTITTGAWTSTGGTFSLTGNLARNGGTFNANGGTIAFNGSTTQTIGGTAVTTFDNLTINNAAGVTVNQDANVNGLFNLTNGKVTVGTNFALLLGAGAVTNATTAPATTSYVIGSVRKTFAANGSFIYPVGTANGYSPLETTVTAGTGDLTVKANQGVQPVLTTNSMISLQRYWTLANTNGAVTANLVFHYLAGDVMATESAYRVVKVSGGVPTYFNNLPPTVFVDATLHTMNIQNLSSFSDWTAGQLAPTAASVNLSGRIVSASGRAVAKARVMLTGGNLPEPRYAITNSLGYYRFADLPTGDYVLSVGSKQRTFAQPVRLVNLTETIEDANFTSEP